MSQPGGAEPTGTSPARLLIDANVPKDVRSTRDAARRLEQAGYDGAWIGETQHDPFLQLLQVAEVTHRVTVGSAVAIAFAQNPMTVAATAYDLAEYAEGRSVLAVRRELRLKSVHVLC